MSNPKDKSKRVFLCHSSGDKAHIRDYYNRLRDAGADPWLDEEELLPGQVREFEVKKALQSSAAVIVFLSKTSTGSAGFVHKEIKMVLDLADERPEGTIFPIPLRLESCDIPERLKHIHYVDLFRDGGFDKVLKPSAP